MPDWSAHLALEGSVRHLGPPYPILPVAGSGLLRGLFFLLFRLRPLHPAPGHFEPPHAFGISDDARSVAEAEGLLIIAEHVEAETGKGAEITLSVAVTSDSDQCPLGSKAGMTVKR
jgi:hypothetical protein